ncbi:MAG: ribulose-5-phosphate 4-epimerase/fuculose-1-phosphate aldolase [Halioglobus sp.]|jgi:ribulose-5-phosphate 4-epimerase/fuculose-1-phosphate aldolase
MNAPHNSIVMNQTERMVFPPEFESVEAEREDRKRKLVSAYRLFGKFGFDEGVAGHITVRDPEHLDRLWVNPMGVSFKQIKVSDLLCVSHTGEVLEGKGLLNGAAYTIHSKIHEMHPRVTAAAHAHSVYGKSWSSLGRKLDPITQDACAFYDDHVVFEDFNGVVLDMNEGDRIATALGDNKAAILRNHGLLTVGETVEAAAWWYITMERTCQAQLMAEAAGTPVVIDDENAKLTHKTVGSELAGWFSYQPLLSVISAEQPDMFD